MPDWIFRSRNQRFGLHIPEAAIQSISQQCRAAGNQETGGLLVGRYLPDLAWAEVSRALDAPKDSKQGPSWFYRGIQGLQATLDRMWLAHEYYLGEWHFHPDSSPDPSRTDIVQMQQIATSLRYHCPEPILLIVGGSSMGGWRKKALVFPRDQLPVELLTVANEQDVL